MLNIVLQITYFVAAVLFILGLKAMSSPRTARRGMIWAGIGMVLATLITFAPDIVDFVNLSGESASLLLTNLLLSVTAIVLGAGVAFVLAKRVEMTDMPQMVALYNGLGGGAAACIAAIALLQQHAHDYVTQVLAVVGALIGAVAFSGSLVAFAKLQGIIKKSWQFNWIQLVNAMIFIATLCLAVYLTLGIETEGSAQNSLLCAIVFFYLLALIFGVTLAMPIGGADMPVVISLFNALTGLAVGLEGYVLQNAAMMIAGIVVGSAGTLLTKLMADAMNRKIGAILFKKFGQAGAASEGGDAVLGSMKETDGNDVAIAMAYAERVIIVPGYGMAVAQAQHKVWELTELLQKEGVDVRFAIHPVAGRMPGHMNVLLAEAGVPYDLIVDLEDVNSEFANTDVVLVIGANDVVNPVARTNPDSPIYGMPILNADEARNVIVIKRGKGAGFSGIENHLFYAENTRMLYGDAQSAINAIIHGLKAL